MMTIRELREILATIEPEWDDVGVFPVVDGYYSQGATVELVTTDGAHPAVLALQCAPFGSGDELPLTPKPSLQPWHEKGSAPAPTGIGENGDQHEG